MRWFLDRKFQQENFNSIQVQGGYSQMEIQNQRMAKNEKSVRQWICKAIGAFWPKIHGHDGCCCRCCERKKGMLTFTFTCIDKLLQIHLYFFSKISKKGLDIASLPKQNVLKDPPKESVPKGLDNLIGSMKDNNLIGQYGGKKDVVNIISTGKAHIEKIIRVAHQE